MWKVVLSGALIGVIGKIGILAANYYASFVSGTPSAGFRFLLNQAFSRNASTVSDGEAAAIMNAATWFSEALLPALVGVGLGLTAAILLRLSVGTVVFASIVFAALHISFGCCHLLLEEVIGSILFLFAISGAQYLVASFRLRRHGSPAESRRAA